LERIQRASPSELLTWRNIRGRSVTHVAAAKSQAGNPERKNGAFPEKLGETMENPEIHGKNRGKSRKSLGKTVENPLKWKNYGKHAGENWKKHWKSWKKRVKS
jgi:hypothetical protein